MHGFGFREEREGLGVRFLGLNVVHAFGFRREIESLGVRFWV